MSVTHNHEPMLDAVGLVSGCPRCEELADDPRGLAPSLLRSITARFQAGAPGYSTRLNARLVSQMERAFILSRNVGWHDRESMDVEEEV